MRAAGASVTREPVSGTSLRSWENSSVLSLYGLQRPGRPVLDSLDVPGMTDHRSHGLA